MSDLKDPTQVLLFASVLYNQKKFDHVQINHILESKFGNFIIYQNGYFPMKEYYSKEMGQEDELDRYFLFFSTKCSRQKLLDAKIFCDELERKYAEDGKRIINIDPGYVSADQVLLATGKPYSHRVYLDRGIYAELTYKYHDKSYETFGWTYPDYSQNEIIEKFNWFREFLFV